jgi:sugar phosphate isomerase/epimerase
MEVGLIGIIENELATDFFGSVKRVAGIGYRGMEFGLSTIEHAPAPIPEARKRMEDMGIKIINFHILPQILQEDFAGTVRKAHEAACPYLTIAWGPVESADQLKQDAETYDGLGRRLKAEGLQLVYHNHDHELKVFDGKHGLDILMENTAPDHLQGQFDVCWLRFGGVDPAQFIRKYPGRVPLIHLKDLGRLEPGCETANGDRDKTLFTEVGTGIVDFEDVFEAGNQVGAIWGSVEQDRMRNLAPFESITCSYLNLKARGLI